MCVAHNILGYMYRALSNFYKIYRIWFTAKTMCYSLIPRPNCNSLGTRLGITVYGFAKHF